MQGVQTNSAVFVDGGTLGGSGLLGPVTANRGAVGPGASPGILQVNGGVTLHAGSSLFVELNGSAPGTGHDQLNVIGPVNLDNVTLAGTVAFTSTVGEVVTILDNDGTDPISGSFGDCLKEALSHWVVISSPSVTPVVAATMWCSRVCLTLEDSPRSPDSAMAPLNFKVRAKRLSLTAWKPTAI